MTMIKSKVDEGLDAQQRNQLAALFHALADPTRLQILEHLKIGEHKVKDLTEHLGLAQSTVSAHLACLRDSELVSVRTQGRASMYSLNDSPQLEEVLSRAGELSRPGTNSHHWNEQHPHAEAEK